MNEVSHDNTELVVVPLQICPTELGCDEKLFKRIVKQAFSQRRKMLRNTLKPFFKNPDLLKDEFFMKRPEVLTVEEFVELTKKIESLEEG